MTTVIHQMMLKQWRKALQPGTYPDVLGALWQSWSDDVQSQKNMIALVYCTIHHLTLWPASIETDLCKLHLALNLWPFAFKPQCIIALVNLVQKQFRQWCKNAAISGCNSIIVNSLFFSSDRFRWIILASLDLNCNPGLFVILHAGCIPMYIIYIL